MARNCVQGMIPLRMTLSSVPSSASAHKWRSSLAPDDKCHLGDLKAKTTMRGLKLRNYYTRSTFDSVAGAWHPTCNAIRVNRIRANMIRMMRFVPMRFVSGHSFMRAAKGCRVNAPSGAGFGPHTLPSTLRKATLIRGWPIEGGDRCLV